MASTSNLLFLFLMEITIFTKPVSAASVSVTCLENVGDKGGLSKLTCTVTGQEGLKILKIFWKKDDVVVRKVLRDDGSPGDPRFQLADANWMTSKNVSLVVMDTKLSDAGNYSCTVATNMGMEKVNTKLKVRANYTKPTSTSMPDKNIKEGDRVDLTCQTSGGYPRGHIQWFDSLGTNWTRSADTEEIKQDDGTFTLVSHFTKANSGYQPFRCTVLNSEWQEEGNKEIHLDLISLQADNLNPETKQMVAAVVVIGSLICGLLVALLFFRRRSRRRYNEPDTYDHVDSQDHRPLACEDIAKDDLDMPQGKLDNGNPV